MAAIQRVLWMQSSPWLWLEFAANDCQCHVVDIQQPGWTTQLLQLTQRLPKSPLFLVSDLADERYEVHALPASPARLHAALLARKLAAWPSAAAPHTAIRLPPMQQGSLTPAYLFVALDAPPVNELLAVLAAAGHPPTGLYLASLSLPCWLPMLAPLAAQCLYLQVAGASIRICYLRHQQLLASETLRLSVSESSPHATGSVLAVEQPTTQSMQGIVRQLQQLRLAWQQQQWLLEEQPLQVVWCGPMPDTDAIQSLCACLPLHTDWHWLRDTDLPARLQPPKGAGLTATQWAALYPLFTGWPLPTLHADHLAQVAVAKSMRRPLHGLCMLTAVLLLITAVHLWWDIQRLSAQRAALNPEMTRAPAPAPHALDGLKQLRAYRLASERLAAGMQLPTSALALLQQVATEQPYWRLTELDWQVDSSGETLDMTWQAAQLDRSADAAWQHIIAQIHGLPQLDQLEKLPPQADAGIALQQRGLQGDTDWGGSISREQRLRIHLVTHPAEASGQPGAGQQ